MLPEQIKGHPSPTGFDLCGAAVGTVALDGIITGEAITPGDVLVGVPSSGLHSNGYTLARRAILEQGGLGFDDTPEELGGATVVDALLEPTVIYVRAALDLIRSDVEIHGSRTSPAAASPPACASVAASATRSTRRCRCPASSRSSSAPAR